MRSSTSVIMTIGVVRGGTVTAVDVTNIGLKPCAVMGAINWPIVSWVPVMTLYSDF